MLTSFSAVNTPEQNSDAFQSLFPRNLDKNLYFIPNRRFVG